MQGLLEIMLGHARAILLAVSGHGRASASSPGGGSHAVFTNACMVRAWHAARGQLGQRDEIITTMFSHPCDAGVAATAGFKVSP